ncbi:unnamed protein product [Linum trigynum]|uniref:Uncharacterized protein n=1 Tax=Linum trigynum TaxID=586398 RepID=A0AAV2F8G7_9ROSI
MCECAKRRVSLKWLQVPYTAKTTQPCGFLGCPCELPGLSTRPQGVPYPASVACPCNLVPHGQVTRSCGFLDVPVWLPQLLAKRPIFVQSIPNSFPNLHSRTRTLKYHKQEQPSVKSA